MGKAYKQGFSFTTGQERAEGNEKKAKTVSLQPGEGKRCMKNAARQQ